MTTPTIYIFINKGLGMSAGKVAAQAAHATATAILAASGQEQHAEWLKSPHRFVIVLEGRNEAHMRNIPEYLLERGIGSRLVIDEGANEIDPHTITAIATEIVDKEDPDVQKTMSTFHLYRDAIRVTLEIPR